MPDELPEVRFIIHGIAEFNKSIQGLEAREMEATRVAVRKASAYISRRVKKRLSGRPRWGHRGRSRVYPEAVNLGFNHHPRSGSMGMFTGKYRSGVGYRKNPRLEGSEYVGGVGIGGSHIPENNFKKRFEAQYPGFAPAVHGSDAGVEAIFYAAWKSAAFGLSDVKGIFNG